MNQLRPIAFLSVLLLLLAGGSAARAQQPSGFFPITPCRVYDSRWAHGPMDGSSVPRPIPIASHCGVAPDATAAALNITAVGPNATASISAYPTGVAPTNTTVVAFPAGVTRASNAVIKLGPDGQINLLLSPPLANQSHVIVDVAGYFRPSALVQQWRRWEQTILSAVDYTQNGGSPYRDLRLFVRFTNAATGEGFVQNAYWDVDRTQPRVFKFGVALPAGTWNWQLDSCTRSGIDCLSDGWTPSSGSLFVQSNTSSGIALYDLGFPGQEETIVGAETTEVSRYVYPDRANFNWIADTVWTAPPREIALPANQRYWTTYLNKRRLQGFKVIQIAPAVTWQPDLSTDPDEPKARCDDWWENFPLPSALNFSFTNPPGCAPSGGMPYDCSEPVPAYWKALEQMVKEANDRDLTVAVFGVMNPLGLPDKTGSPYPTTAGANAFAFDLAGRLSGYNVIYSPSFDDKVAQAPLINAVGRTLRDTLSPLPPPPGFPPNLKRPALSVHLAGGAAKCGDYKPYGTQSQANRWITSYLFQSGHGGSPGNVNNPNVDVDCPGFGTDLENAMRRARQMPLVLDNYAPKFPAVNAEGPYDAVDVTVPTVCPTPPNAPPDDRLRSRQAGYLSALSNGAGYSYGVHKLFMWLTPANYVDRESALDIKRLSGHLKTLNPIARHGWVLNQSAAEDQKMVLATAGTQRLMAYLPIGNRRDIRISTATSGWILNCTPGTWVRTWHNAATGAVVLGGEPNSDTCMAGAGYVEYKAPLCVPSGSCDWLLKVRKSTSAQWPSAETSGFRDRALAVWEEFSELDGTTAIRAAVRTGDRLASTTDVSPMGRSFQSSPIATPLGDGFLVVWQAEGIDGSLSGIVGAQLDADATIVSGPLVLNAYTEHNQREPSAAGRPDGEALVVWSSVGQANGRTGIYGRLFRSGAGPFGDPRGGEMRISSPDEGFAQNPQVLAHRGGYWVAWEVVGLNGKLTSLRLRHLNPQGTPVGREIRVGAAEGEQVQLLDLDAQSGDSVRARWWRLDRSGRLLSVANQDARPSGLVGSPASEGSP